MNPLDRIAQLTERAENAEEQCDIVQRICESAQREVALLRSQLADARQQLERDSATIAKLAKDKREILEQLLVALCFVEDCEHSEDYKPGIVSSRLKAIREILSRHA